MGPDWDNLGFISVGNGGLHSHDIHHSSSFKRRRGSEQQTRGISSDIDGIRRAWGECETRLSSKGAALVEVTAILKNSGKPSPSGSDISPSPRGGACELAIGRAEIFGRTESCLLRDLRDAQTGF